MEEVAKQPVKGWKAVKPALVMAAEKALAFYQNQMVPKHENAKEPAAALADCLAKMKKAENPTYGELNGLLGDWLTKNVENHQYEITETDENGNKSKHAQKLQDNSSSNMVGTSLDSFGGFSLPNHMISRSRTTFEGDIEKIVAKYLSESAK